MPTQRPRALVVILAALLGGCAPAVAPIATPAPPPVPAPSPLPISQTSARPPATAPSVDAVALAISRAETEFEAGKADFDQARLVAAREHFDGAVDIFLLQPGGTRSDPRLQEAFERLIDRIAALDVLALRDADGITEARSNPAAIDEVLNAAVFEAPAPKTTTAETVADDLARTQHDVPIVPNAKVLAYVELFQGRLHDFMQQGLDRSQRYLPMIQAVFRAEGLPLDLAYVPLIESAFMPNAVSRAKAKGVWQFMQGTALENGLRHNWYIDERSDPEKATLAAAKYLKTLSKIFGGDWHLALASYNGGPGRMQRALKTARVDNFWTLPEQSKILPRETREYVPMILAAIVIARNPSQYGFDFETEEPAVFDKVTLP